MIFHTLLHFVFLPVCLTTSFPFPFGELLNTNNTEYIEGARQAYSCNGTALSPDICNCNANCMSSRSCCIDMFWNHKNFTTLEDYLSYFFNMTNGEPVHTCKDPFYPVRRRKKKVRHYQKYVLVTTCRLLSPALERLCRDETSVDNLLPVVAEDNVLYKNQYCAHCNGIYDFEYLKTRNVCRNKTHPFHPERPPKLKCKIVVDDPKADLSACPSVKRNCPKSNVTYHDLCHMYGGTFLGHANYHCWRCNSTDAKPKTGREGRTEGKPPTWSQLLSFGQKRKFKHNKEGAVCAGGKRPDFKTGKCIDRTKCDDGFTLVNSKCVPKKDARKRGRNLVPRRKVFSEISNMGKPDFYKCLISHQPSVYLAYDVQLETKVLNAVRSIVHNSSLMLLPHHEHANTLIGEIPAHFVADFLNKFHNSSSLLSKITNLVEEVIIVTLNPHIQYNKNLDVTHQFKENSACAETVVVNTNSTQFYNSCSVHHESGYHDISNIGLTMRINQFNSTQTIAICKMFYLQSDCLMNNLTGNNISITEDKSLIHYDLVTGVNTTYNVSQYIPLDGVGSYGVCLEPAVEPKWRLIILNVERYVMYIGTFASIICYIICLLAFVLCKDQFSSSHGLKCLTVSLFLADLLYSIALILKIGNVSVGDAICKTIGFLTHLALLVAEAWAFVACVDLATTFRKHGAPKRTSHRIQTYCLQRSFIMLPPLLITILAFVLDEKDILDTGYGAGGVCLFTGFYGRIAFYVIPTAIMITLSISLISFVMYRITENNKENKERLKDSKSTSHISITVITLKLVLTFGLPEIIGFVQIAGSDLALGAQIFNSATGFLYTILRSFRGVLLFVVYICRKGVIKLLKKRFLPERKNAEYVEESRAFSDTNMTTQETSMSS